MKNFPETKEEARTLLREIMHKDKLWHFDDDPSDVFKDEDNAWRVALVKQLITLWASDVPESDKHQINVGAWKALEECCPEIFDPNSWFWKLRTY